MGLFTSTADRLRSGPALLLPFDPGMPQVLSALRLYDPAARERKGRVQLDGGLELSGPIEITPELSQQAGLPYGQTAAYLASGKGNFAVFNASRLVSGLIVRLGGTIHPAPPNRLMILEQMGDRSSALSQQIDREFADDPGLSPFATVLARTELSADHLIGLLGEYAPGLTVRYEVAEDVDEADNTWELWSDESPLRVEYTPPELFVPQMAPPAAAELREGGDVHEYMIRLDMPSTEVTSEIARNLGEAALTLSRTLGGVCLDTYDFLLARPEELCPPT
jgi:hypothetical protein